MQRSPDIRAYIAPMLQSAARIAKKFRLRKDPEWISVQVFQLYNVPIA